MASAAETSLIAPAPAKAGDTPAGRTRGGEPAATALSIRYAYPRSRKI